MRINLRNFLIVSTCAVPACYLIWVLSGCLPLYGFARWIAHPPSQISQPSHPGIPD